MKTMALRIMLLAAVSSLAACDNNSSRAGSGNGGNSPAATSSFSLARGCYNLQSVNTGGFVSADESGYSASNPNASSAETFFMQPAVLAKYIFLASDERMLTAGSGAVAGNASVSNAAIWTASFTSAGKQYSFVSETSGEALSVDESGKLITAADASGDAAQFRFKPASQACAEYPEMPIGVSGDTYKGKGVSKPIIGFADVHTHMGMSSEMSLDDSVGPSAAGAIYGHPVHRFGAPHALEDCESVHGPNGIRDGNNLLNFSPTDTHDTVGWPSFAGWPVHNSLTHNVMYYRWVERAWKAGLRVMVNHGTNIAGICTFGSVLTQQLDADCDDMSVAVKQIEYLYDIQDYIDAQHGGPGKGWYRIVKSPTEARQVINDGKLAVILGIEVAQVFDCGVTFLPGGTELRNCDEAQIDAELDRLWDLGVRHVYPFHDINSALGGTGLFSGDLINLAGFVDTGAFWKTTECRNYPMDEPFVREPGAEQTVALPGLGGDPLTALLLEASGGVLPVYPAGRRCNARTVTDLGYHALNALMDKRMIIDIDHATYHSKDIMLDLAEARTPAYPMASSHDAHGGLTSDQAVRMLKSGGTIYPYKGSGVKHRDFLEKLKFWHAKAGSLEAGQLLGLGFGVDGNGLGGHPGPRGGDSEPVQYPFTLFQGAEWGSQFQGIAPLTFDLLSIPESGKFWHIDEVGMAHYGLVADFVEEVRLESGKEGLDALYNSAEAFIQMWERVWNR